MPAAVSVIYSQVLYTVGRYITFNTRQYYFILLKLKIFIPKKWHEKLMKFGMAASQLAIGALWVQLCIEEWQCIQFRSRHTEACKYNSKLRSVPPLQCESIWNIWSCVVNFKPAIAPKKIFWLLPKNSYAYKFFIAR